jgi:hypothetical protein
MPLKKEEDALAREQVELKIISAISGDHICIVSIQLGKFVKQLKNAIFEKSYIPKTEQRLLYGETELTNTRTLLEFFPDCQARELTLVRNVSAINGILATFMNRAAEERPQEDTTWQNLGDFSIKDALNVETSAAAAASAQTDLSPRHRSGSDFCARLLKSGSSLDWWS